MRARPLRAVPAAVALVLCLAAPSPAQAPLGPPSATLRIQSTSVAAGVGVSWGTGVLVLDGVEHPVSMSGLSVLDVGVARVDAVGEVWNLRRPEDIDGTYYGVDVGAAVGGGGSGVAMRNQNGVYVKLRAAQQGVKFSIASKGTQLKLERPR